MSVQSIEHLKERKTCCWNKYNDNIKSIIKAISTYIIYFGIYYVAPGAVAKLVKHSPCMHEARSAAPCKPGLEAHTCNTST